MYRRGARLQGNHLEAAQLATGGLALTFDIEVRPIAEQNGDRDRRKNDQHDGATPTNKEYRREHGEHCDLYQVDHAEVDQGSNEPRADARDLEREREAFGCRNRVCSVQHVSGPTVPPTITENHDSVERELIGRVERVKASRKDSFDNAIEIGRLYRGVTAEAAALADPNSGDSDRLRSAITEGYRYVYGAQPFTDGFKTFFGSTFWLAIARRRKLIKWIMIALFVFAGLGALWAALDPSAAATLVPDIFGSALDPGSTGTATQMSPGEQVQFAQELFVNNFRVTLMAFVAGIAFGLPSIYLLAYNSVLLGVVGQLLVAQGDGAFFLELVAGHGPIELTSIALGVAAGFAMGWALVDPGLRSRGQALREEASYAIVIAVGTAPWLLLAAVIESFVSRVGLSAAPVVAVGLTTVVIFWRLVWTRGIIPLRDLSDLSSA